MIRAVLSLPDVPQLPPGLIAELRENPAYALETLALAAVDVHGPAAEKWVRSKGSARYSKAQLAEIAVRKATNSARVEGGALGMGGFMTIAPDAVALGWILTREVIFVAAAYGLDPTDKARAAEVLVICEIYDTVAKAQAALDHHGEPLAAAMARTKVLRHLRGGPDRSFSSRMFRFAGKRLARRFGGRLVPGVGAVLGVLDNATAAKETGERAIAYYRGR
jgi:hypothetical protein